MNNDCMKKINELLKAIKRKCRDCSGGCKSEVENCTVYTCPLYDYRRSAEIDLAIDMTPDDLKNEKAEPTNPVPAKDSEQLDSLLDEWDDTKV